MRKNILGLAVAATLVSGNAIAATSVEDKIEILQQEIEALKDQIAKSEPSNKASGIQSFADKTTIGGYGELHYNNFMGDVPAGSTRKQDEVDLHRFVLFFGHRFNDWISLKSELELEHSNTETGGAVELEQAYLDFNFSEKVNAKAGIFLIPLGFLNETHEPPTFYGVERNNIETRIIPTTWWEAGASLYGEVAPGWKYQAGVTSSLSADNFNSFATRGLRDGRRNVSNAPAEDFGVHGRLDYSGIPGVTVGASMFTGNTGQDDSRLNGADARLTLWDVHARYNVDKLDVKALYAQGHLNDAGKINDAFGYTDVASRFYGWYTEAAYHVWKNGDNDLAPFVRYEKWDTQADLPGNAIRNTQSSNNVWTVGANYWPHPQVVLKADYQKFDKPDGTSGDKRLNLGLGYMF